MPSATRPRRRRRVPRSLAAALIAAALGASLLAIAAPASAAPAATQVPAGEDGPPAAVPELGWVPCEGGPVECATADVPLDYGDPDGRTVTLSVARLRATNQAEKIGSLFINPGGPGGSAVNLLLSFGDALFPPEVTARYDIVAVDPRGVGFSEAVECFGTFGEALVFYADDVIFPVTPEEEQVAAEKSIAFAERCWQTEGDLLTHLSTANVARDLDLIRQALGDDRFNFVGYSYGTILGATYANLFPDNVGAMVLDGVMSTTYTGPREAGALASHRIGSDVGSAEALQHFFDLCAEAGAACPFGADGDPRAKFDELAARLRAEPVVVDLGGGATFEFGYAELIANTISGLYAPDWTFLATDLQITYEEQTQEAALQMVRHAAHAHPASPVKLLESQQGALRGFTVGDPASTAIICADADTPDDPFAWPKLAAESEARAPYAGEFWSYAGEQPCASWERRDPNRYTGPYDAETANPALIIGTLFDPATPYKNAVALADVMPGSRLLTLDGVGHTTFGAFGSESACIDDAASAYLLEGTLPAEGTVCASDLPPLAPLEPGV